MPYKLSTIFGPIIAEMLQTNIVDSIISSFDVKMLKNSHLARQGYILPFDGLKFFATEPVRRSCQAFKWESVGLGGANLSKEKYERCSGVPASSSVSKTCCADGVILVVTMRKIRP